MVHGVKSGQDLQMLLDRADAIVIGPGLGQSYWGEQLLQQVMAVHTPVMLDADALNILAKGRIKHNLAERISVLTPHPGEASRLLGLGSSEIQSHINLNRFDVVKDLVNLYSSSVVLKGVGSLICTQVEEGSDEHLVSICNDGNAGMATGGMGDVLSGILGSLMAQSLNSKIQTPELTEESSFAAALQELVVSAVCLHSAAADVAAKQGQAGLLGSDVINSIRGLLK
jgi:NAD(P)H-hydrate epimerase